MRIFLFCYKAEDISKNSFLLDTMGLIDHKDMEILDTPYDLDADLELHKQVVE